MPEHEADATQVSPAREVGEFLRRRREQIAQRWADEPLFRTVFTVSRDEAVDAGRVIVDALAQVADAQRIEDPDAAGFTGVREQLARMGRPAPARGCPPPRSPASWPRCCRRWRTSWWPIWTRRTPSGGGSARPR